jgi:uncharacterized surface protein with fasciclin (FAS1) repeats
MKFAAFALVAMMAGVAAAAAADSYPSISAAVKGLPETSSLAAKYDVSSLGNEYSSGDTKDTVFLPNNAAFDSMLKMLNNAGFDASTLADGSILTPALQHHIVQGQVLTMADLTDGKKLTMADGETVTVKVNPTTKKVTLIGGAPTNTATIVRGPITAGKGAVYIIDGVLLNEAYATSFAQANGDGAGVAGLLAPDSAAAANTTAPTVASAATKAANKTAAAVTGAAAAATGAVKAAAAKASPSPAPSSAAGVSVAAAALAVPALLALL